MDKAPAVAVPVAKTPHAAPLFDLFKAPQSVASPLATVTALSGNAIQTSILSPTYD